MDKVSAIKEIVDTAIGASTFPGAVVGYVHQGVQHVFPFGHLTYDDDAPAVTADTVYDLASITKSIPTSSIILSLVEKGRLALNDTVRQFIPGLSEDIGKQVTIWHLLTYTAVFDLPRYLSTYAPQGGAAIMEAVLSAPLKYPPGEHYFYADIPPIILGMVAEKITGKPLDQIADELFFVPLEMNHTSFHPETLKGASIAPTENTEQGIVAGKAHDEKARVFHDEGRVVGHAGLFSTVEDLLRYCQMLLAHGVYKGHHYFSPQTISYMQTEVFNEDGYGVSLGWRTHHPGFLLPTLPPHIFGKEGFTGSSIVLDPDANRCVVLLANRTYPKRPDTPAAIQHVRRQLAHLLLT